VVTGGDNIICFAKDWDEDPTSNNHVMVELARRGGRVLWLNSISTRTPNLASGRDLKKIFRKIAGFSRGARRVRENLWVYTPIVLPLPHSRWAKAVNRLILRASLRLLRRKLGMDAFQLWTFLPNAADYVGALGESVSVYYCVDEWAKFNYVDGARTAAAERELVGRVDAVFAVAQSLVDNRRPINPETHLARHGVDHGLFAKALDDSTEVPADLAAIRGPVIGFYGTLQDWVDLDLVCHLARKHPEWSVVLIGKPMADLSRLRQLPNVHVLGRKPHEQLPAYCKGFSVGIIPYVVDDRIVHVNPIKLREYLSAGLPVVSVALPEVAPYAGLCTTAATYDEFERGVEEALQTDSPQRRRERSEAMRSETWAARVEAVCQHVARVRQAKAAQPGGPRGPVRPLAAVARREPAA
jgi:glycosyltransferase involved in cell wall biosynthesis